jgi:hypothetical protein
MSSDRDQDEQYRSAIRALAGSATIPTPSAARIERDLLRNFAEYHAEPRRGAPGARERGGWRPWFAAAAAVVAISIGLGIWWASHRVTENHVTTASVRPAASAPNPGSRTLGGPEEGTPATTVSVKAVKGFAANRNPTRRRMARVVRPAGFVVIPGAAGLPQFESGTIMRIELPVASLPAYGVDISPAADDQPIEADVLVGQDGQARAIRLVTSSSRSSQ